MIRFLVAAFLALLVSTAHCSMPQFDFNRPTGYPIRGISDVVNVLDFGADPTNIQDSAVAIQNALDYASAHGFMRVYIPAGLYKIKTGLTMNGVEVFGDGPGQTGSTRGGSMLFSGSGNMTTGTVMTMTAPTSHGGMRSAFLHDIAILCNAGPAVKGLQMAYPVEGVKMNVTAVLDSVRIQYCDYGVRTSAGTGHQTLTNVQALNNFCGLTVDPDGSGGTDGGNLTSYNSAFVGSSFSGMCVSGTTGTGVGDFHFTRTAFGFSPYGIYQFGPATVPFLASGIFDDCEFEGIGNNAIGVREPSGNGGALNNLQFRFVGFGDSTTDANYNLPTASCVGPGDPYPCCIAANSGCSKAYAVEGGTCSTIREEPTSIHPFSTPSGGSGAIHCLQCQSQIKMTWDNSTSPVVVCDTHAEFVNIYDAQGRSRWWGGTPLTTAPTCASTLYGSHYYDSNLKWDCVCNDSSGSAKWCWAHSPTTCSSSSSCGTTSTSTTTTTSSSSTTTS